jgi:hypothetical protein
MEIYVKKGRKCIEFSLNLVSMKFLFILFKSSKIPISRKSDFQVDLIPETSTLAILTVLSWFRAQMLQSKSKFYENNQGAQIHRISEESR